MNSTIGQSKDWECGTLFSDSTPFGAAFAIGSHVHFRKKGATFVAFNHHAVRLVTPYQISACVNKGPPCDRLDASEAQYRSLRRALLASPFGYLELRPTPEPRVRPMGIPHAYKGASVTVCDRSPLARSPGWMGEHLIDPERRCAVFLETRFARAIAAMRRWDILRTTLDHELFESALELALVRQEFPDAQPRQCGGLCAVMNGLAHKVTVKVVDRVSGERKDNDLMDAWSRDLQLPRSG
jgi:hypothetical protein